jgi:hypothetical protein
MVSPPIFLPMTKFLFAAAALACAAVAQSPLTTTFANNNGGSVGGGVYFDLTVNVPVVITGMDLNVSGSGSVNIYTISGTRTGNQTNQAAWTLASSGTVTGGVAGVPSPLGAMAPIPLPPGTYGVALAGVGVSHNYTNGTGANQTYSTSELTLNAGEASNTAFVGGLFTPRVVNCNIQYTIGGGGGVAAGRTSYGTGCLATTDVPFYENFASAAAFDLANTSMTLLHTGSGFLAIPGISLFRSTAGATALSLTDDSETTVALSAPLKVGATGSTSALTICSNGFISVATGNGVGFTPSSATMLVNPQTGWYCWHDFNPAAVGSGQVKFEEAGGVAYVTFDGVYDYGGTTAANANTFQFQFELATGTVHVVWQGMSGLGNAFLVGFAEGGNSADPGSTDISVALPSSFSAATFKRVPVALAASARPVIGNNVTLTTTNIPAGAPFGALLIGFAQFNPGIQLPILPVGCVQHNEGFASQLFFPAGNSGSASLGFLNPVANFPGLTVQVQSAVYTGSPLALTSNGVALTIGNY